ncbi:MAG TPA: CPBP family intramembrane glutamic endopeptidase [Candidatus Limnocylindria bacterium]|jgi:membrane protease YdiL (CAAX protease family)|nr:CPBP family intramembrane glutamic endopeptidase [Candidatus Limnocylindria bacterium]
MRGGWRLLIYAALVAGLGFGGGIVLQQFIRPTRGVFSLGSSFAYEVFCFTVVFGAALIMAQIEGRSPGAYGLPLNGAFGKLFWQGCLIGLVEISVLVGLIAVFGGYSFGDVALHGKELLRWGILWAVFFVFVGLFEEFTFRGYTQYTLAESIGFWPAAILLSCSFGAVHLGNPGEGWVGAAGVVMIGLIFAFALRRTGNLWLVVGWHVSFDFGETFLYSVPNSGIVFEGHLSNASLHGAKWLTGGTVGPEGSVFSFLTMGILAFAIHLLLPAKKTEPAQT